MRDFDTKGVIHYLGLNAGVSMWRNPAQVPLTGVTVTYCDGNGREDSENILEYFKPCSQQLHAIGLVSGFGKVLLASAYWLYFEATWK